MKEKNKGITLIALVVTIVVLLILAGVSIAMLTGDNGIITQSQNAKNNTEQAKVEEHVSVAIGSLITKFNGEINGITPKMIADQINEDENRSDVYAENETTFPTYIIFPKENRKAEANLNTKGATETDSIYSADVNEADIAPVDLFDYEIINNGETGALKLDNLPTRTAKITRIKPEYCNHYGYNPNTDKEDYTNTNYEIVYKGNNISKTLIIPYQVDGKYIPNGIEGEYYKVTEVSLIIEEKCEWTSDGKAYASIPNVEELVYPNTVEKIISKGSCNIKFKLKNVVLSNSIKEIPKEMFCLAEKLASITISNSVTSIGSQAFSGCSGLTSITIPNSVTSIGNYAFCGCSKLTNINMPDGVISIENSAFEGCSSLTSITIPDSVTSIGDSAFKWCNSLTTVNYTGTEEEWNKISIEDRNDYLTDVTINYNYKQ